jgi:hypothetical protein
MGLWFYPGTPVSSTSKTDHHDITEILLKVALNTITIKQVCLIIEVFYIHQRFSPGQSSLALLYMSDADL